MNFLLQDGVESYFSTKPSFSSARMNEILGNFHNPQLNSRWICEAELLYSEYCFSSPNPPHRVDDVEGYERFYELSFKSRP